MEELILVGIDHTTAPVEVRGRFAFTDTQKLDFAALVQSRGAEEVVVLSTCNRSMVFCAAREGSGLGERLDGLYLDFFQGEDCRKCLIHLEGRQAVEELFAVTCGLRSVVVGEDQILGQVRQAHLFAARTGGAGKVLNKIFREAVTLAKEVKTQLGISQIPLSVSYIGIKLLARTAGGLKGRRVVVAGLGKMNRLSLEYLTQEGAGEVLLCTRDRDKALAWAEQFPHCRPVPFEGRYEALEGADVLITATASPHVIFRREGMPEGTGPLTVLDMAVPRDTDPALEELPGVRIFTVDDLKRRSQDNLERREELARAAWTHIGERAGETMDWLLSARTDPTIQSLNQRCRAIADDTTACLAAKLELNDRQRKLVDKMVSSALRRLVREPVLRLRQAGDQERQEEYIRVMQELFDLEGET